jgi:hypothetical protein
VVDRWSIAGQAAVLVLLAATAGTGIVSPDLFTRIKGHNLATLARRVVERQGILGGFSFVRRTSISRSIHAAQGESLPNNRHLHQFLTFLKHERGFAEATMVNRERSP